MTGEDVRAVGLMVYNTDVGDFAKHIYGIDLEEDDSGRCAYVKGKYKLMREKPVSWICELDIGHLAKLAEFINIRYQGGEFQNLLDMYKNGNVNTHDLAIIIISDDRYYMNSRIKALQIIDEITDNISEEEITGKTVEAFVEDWINKETVLKKDEGDKDGREI